MGGEDRLTGGGGHWQVLAVEVGDIPFCVMCRVAATVACWPLHAALARWRVGESVNMSPAERGRGRATENGTRHASATLRSAPVCSQASDRRSMPCRPVRVRLRTGWTRAREHRGPKRVERQLLHPGPAPDAFPRSCVTMLPRPVLFSRPSPGCCLPVRLNRSIGLFPRLPMHLVHARAAVPRSAPCWSLFLAASDRIQLPAKDAKIRDTKTETPSSPGK